MELNWYEIKGRVGVDCVVSWVYQGKITHQQTSPKSQWLKWVFASFYWGLPYQCGCLQCQSPCAGPVLCASLIFWFLPAVMLSGLPKEKHAGELSAGNGCLHGEWILTPLLMVLPLQHIITGIQFPGCGVWSLKTLRREALSSWWHRRWVKGQWVNTSLVYFCFAASVTHPPPPCKSLNVDVLVSQTDLLWEANSTWTSL